MDLGQLWRSRQWRKLLNLIDHLPQDTYYHQAMVEDPDNASALAKQMANAKPAPPPLHQWSPERAMLASIGDELRLLRHVLTLVNSKTPPKTPELFPRPEFGAVKRSEHERRRAQHEALADRVLMRRQQPPSDEQ